MTYGGDIMIYIAYLVVPQPSLPTLNLFHHWHSLNLITVITGTESYPNYSHHWHGVLICLVIMAWYLNLFTVITGMESYSSYSCHWHWVLTYLQSPLACNVNLFRVITVRSLNLLKSSLSFGLNLTVITSM